MVYKIGWHANGGADNLLNQNGFLFGTGIALLFVNANYAGGQGMKAMKYWVGLVGLVALVASAQASATLINFENAHSDHGLNDNDPITNQYQTSDGVTFSGPHGTFIEHSWDGTPNDSDPQGFLNDRTGHWDQQSASLAAGTPGLGDWFLRTNGLGSNGGGSGGTGLYLTIDYDSVVHAASGQIWDIDGNGTNASEQWLVEAYLNGSAVASDTSPLGTSTGTGSLNGLPWTFNLMAAGGFDQIQISFIGTKKSGLGLAFDNFNTNSASVPEPAALGMFGLGALLVGLFAGLRRRIG